jgi:UDP-N-acetylmuramoylalanine-D-glutamate ligase
VLAITGTNGKTTVTSLTGKLVAHAGKSVAVAGNIGPTLLDTLAERIDAGQLPEAWVLELSSFQLDGVRGFEPTAAAVLNVTQDHLDWHGDMAAYAAAKARIFGEQALMVLNRDDALVMAMLPPPGRPKAASPLGGQRSERSGKRGGAVHAAASEAEAAKAAAPRPCDLWRRHAAAPGRFRYRGRQRHGLAGARARPTKPCAAARTPRRSCTSSA